MERIILSSSGLGDLVLDPMCGSGTTGVAAVRHGRRFLGNDLNTVALEVAGKRLEDEINGVKKPGKE